MIICTMPGCQTTAGCICNRSTAAAHTFLAMQRAVVTDEMVTAAMREFEKWSPLLRYPEVRGWHANDRMGMREAIKAALEASNATTRKAPDRAGAGA